MNFYKGVFRLVSKEEVARDTVKYRFKTDEDFEFSSGQFVSMQFGDVWRAYSIASTNEHDFVELVIRLIPGGAASEILRLAKNGDEFNFSGPFGEFVLSNNKQANLFFLGTGTGIAPLRSMILTEKKGLGRHMTLLYGGKDFEDLAYLDELDDWSDNLKIKLGLSRQENAGDLKEYAENCRITKFIEEHDFKSDDEFYICGNGDMIESVVEILNKKGIGEKNIFYERFN